MRQVFQKALVSLVSLTAMILTAGRVSADIPSPPKDTMAMMKGTQTAVLAGGCFWGMEGVFERLKGVVDVTSGYSGGDADTAHYEMVGSGTTGHAESIQIHYDPSQISYGTLLKVFFTVAHDPTELDFQGPDYGSQYRSAIFYANEGQKEVADGYIRALDQAKVFPKPIVTQVVPLKAFYPAEDYHQHFLDRNPGYPYIVFYDLPKIATLKRMFPQLVASKS
ncbi:MAG TPA: peptide-methionine (S)-S-oxide reductase MsrA [Spirochaetia bacterium]|nr:peptide-methionine (S)-S-oxide reductase MsrA [Spirochaetia bacterium]